MDTPERNQIGTPISKFEDSPVFNYINSLSPIKPVKSIHITQSFSSLSFASLPSVFTSPHVSSHKESRFLRRHHVSDPSKPEFSSDDGNTVGTNEEVMDTAQLCDNAAGLQENFDTGCSIGEASVEPPTECLKLAVELPQTLKYDCGSPDCNSMPYHGIETDHMSELVGASTSLVPFVQEVSKRGSVKGEGHFQGICQIGPKKEGTGCDWESLISDASDLLIFDSPNETEAFKGLIQKSVDPGESFCSSLMLRFPQDDDNDLQETQLVCPVGSGEQHETEEISTHSGEVSKMKEIDQTQDRLASTSLNECTASNPNEKMDNELVSNLHRGMRRRCLVFEMGGARRKSLDNGLNCSSSMLSQSDEKIASTDKQLVPIKPGSDSSRCILPGIGLHLNALATTSKDYKVIKHEILVPGRQLSLPSSSGSFHQPTSDPESLNKLLTSTFDRDTNPAVNGVQVTEDASQATAYLASEEFNQSSPKKKRRRLEHAGESEACKRCNCKKSKCLKLYCECFAAGVYCIEPCSCQECFNKPIHEDTVLATRKQIESRNPLAFAPKVIRNSDSVPDIALQDESSQTPASARHKRGCNCKKSSCLKKYCECYQGGVGCSINCRCEGCKNAFGRKDGSAPIGTEAEPEDEETEKIEKSAVDRSLQKTLIQKDEEQNPDSTLPATPLRLSRLSVQLPFSSKSKPPRSSFLTIGSNSGLQNSQILGKPNFLRPQPKCEKQFQTLQEDGLPEILQENCTPSSGVKSASPNSKRVSPPHCDFGSSPGRRSSRKVILQSIPSFPSLTPQP